MQHAISPSPPVGASAPHVRHARCSVEKRTGESVRVCRGEEIMANLKVIGLLVVTLTGCGASQKAAVVDAVAKSPDQRRSSFEATLRVLDQHPEYVDELYRQTRQHPPTLNRFLANAARDLE